MLMHNACSTVEALVKEHEGIEAAHCNDACFKVFNVKRIDLSHEFFGNHNYMSFTHCKFIKDETVGVRDVVYKCSVFKWFTEWVFFCLVLVHQWTKRVFVPLGLLG